jgi:hypothetical protein
MQEHWKGCGLNKINERLLYADNILFVELK